jgi:hypothetical protein
MESLRTRYKRPQISSSRSVFAVQSQHDRRAVAMIAVQSPWSPYKSLHIFFMKNVAFWTPISPRSKKSENAVNRYKCDRGFTCEGLQNLGLCSALRAIEQGGIFIVPHLLWHRASVFFQTHPKDRPIQSPLTTHKCVLRIYSSPDPHGLFDNRETVKSLWFTTFGL